MSDAIGAQDLLKKRVASVQRVPTGDYFIATITAKTEALDAVPERTTPDGKTLYDWVVANIEAGTAIGDTLSGRADQIAATGDASQVGRLRGVLGELRGAVRLQLKAEPSLPRTLEGDIFGYFDELQRLAVQRRKVPAKEPKPEG